MASTSNTLREGEGGPSNQTLLGFEITGDESFRARKDLDFRNPDAMEEGLKVKCDEASRDDAIEWNDEGEEEEEARMELG